jgi:hypothetical protein
MLSIMGSSGGHMDTITINAVVFQQDGVWVAQCLEHNFVSFAKTQDELPHTLMRQILAQIEIDSEDGHSPFFGFEPAPAKYWEWFERARRQSEPILERSTHQPWVETQLFPVAA